MGGSLSTRHVNRNGEEKEKGQRRKSSGGNFNRKQRHLKQVKRDRKSQRLTKHQLSRLSNELRRTSWYLGRSLHFNEKQVRKVLVKYESAQDQKYVFLLQWRALKGWKATAQALVIQLELAGYDYEEYRSIVASQSNGNPGVYEKPPEIDKPGKGNYQYDDYVDTSKLNTARDREESEIRDFKASMDLAHFLRNSWKKPAQKDKVHLHNDPCTSEDSGIVTSPNVSSHVTDSTSGEVEADTPKRTLTVRRCSDSTVPRSITSSPRHNSETELNRIFENGHAVKVSAVPLSVLEKTPKHDVTPRPLLHHSSQPSVIVRDDDRLNNPQYDDINEGSRMKENCIKFGGRGKYPSRFRDKISGLSLTRNQDIVVSDSDNLRIQIFDRFGSFKHAFDTESELKPKGVFVTAAGDVLVCCGSEIRIFSIGGELKMTFGQGTFRNNSYGICSDVNGNYYVTDIVGHTVSVYDAKGDIRKRFGYLGHKMMNFNQPVALAISNRDELLISDTQNHTVKVYSLAGRPLYAIGGKGTDGGQFWNPFGICFDANGFLYVADCGNDRVSLFDPKYKFLRHVLTSRDGIKMPSFVQITNSNQLVVSEWHSQQIKIYSLETAV